ncbi:hypothetical protein [Marmoricola sp. RAF53]|uniref:hypothetical protein n=1 Tax=Marmoricola sp. RAF53 TaxID=3233059 RepID=UPI003F966C99
MHLSKSRSGTIAVALLAVGAGLAATVASVPSADAGTATTAGVPMVAAQGLVRYGPPTIVPALNDLPADVRAAAQDAAALVEANKDSLLGSFVDTTGKVVAVAANAAGRTLAVANLDAVPVDGDAPPAANLDESSAAPPETATPSEVAAADTVVEPAAVSVETANDYGDQLRATSKSLADAIWMWGADPETQGIFVTVRTELSLADRAAIEAFASQHSVPVRVELTPGQPLPETTESRLTDPSPYAGGARYGIYNGSTSSATGGAGCSFGFGYKIGTTHYMLTAGHCFPRLSSQLYGWTVTGGDAPNFVKSQYAGKSSGTTTGTTWLNGTGTMLTAADNQYHGDLALLNVTTAGRSAGSQIWWDGVTSSNKIPVKTRTAPTVGDTICINGYKSGADCGTVVQKTNISYEYPEGTLRNGDYSYSTNPADCAIPGDSGGSVVVDHPGAETAAEATGIVSGRSVGTVCYNFFTGIEEAIQAWGGNLVFG